jgi:hypothetical protein
VLCGTFYSSRFPVDRHFHFGLRRIQVFKIMMARVSYLSLINSFLTGILTLMLGGPVVGGRATENKALGYRVEAARNVIEEAKPGIKGTFGNILVFNDSIEVQKRRSLPNLDEVVGVNSYGKNRNSYIGRKQGLSIESPNLRISLNVINRFLGQSINGRNLLCPEPHLGDCGGRSAVVLDGGMEPHDLDFIGVNYKIREWSYCHKKPGSLAVQNRIGILFQKPQLQSTNYNQKETKQDIRPVELVLVYANGINVNRGKMHLGLWLVFVLVCWTGALFLVGTAPYPVTTRTWIQFGLGLLLDLVGALSFFW